MNTIDFASLQGENINVEIYDVFLEGWRKSREFTLYKTKSRPFHALFFVCSEMEVSFLQTNYPVITARKGDVVWIPRGSRYAARVIGSPVGQLNTYTVNFALLEMQDELETRQERITVLTNRQDHLFDLHLHNLNDGFHRVQENSTQGRHNLLKAKGEFFLLLDLIAESMTQHNAFYYPIRRGIELFCAEWNKNEKIEVYAAASGVSETYFYRCFRKWSGSSPVEYRNLLRLSNAESLLRCTDMQISEIAKTVGFDDPFYFCRLFSTHFGSSPRNYRSQLQI